MLLCNFGFVCRYQRHMLRMNGQQTNWKFFPLSLTTKVLSLWKSTQAGGIQSAIYSHLLRRNPHASQANPKSFEDSLAMYFACVRLQDLPVWVLLWRLCFLCHVHMCVYQINDFVNKWVIYVPNSHQCVSQKHRKINVLDFRKYQEKKGHAHLWPLSSTSNEGTTVCEFKLLVYTLGVA